MIYREIPNSIVELSDDLPPGRKASLSQRNRTSPLGFLHNMGVTGSIGIEDCFYTNDLLRHHQFVNATCNTVMSKLRRQTMCVNDSVGYEYISCNAIQKMCYSLERPDEDRNVNNIKSTPKKVSHNWTFKQLHKKYAYLGKSII